MQAHALGRLDSGYRGAYAEVAIDCEVRMANKHTMLGTGIPISTVTGTVPLDDAFSRVLASVHSGDSQKDGLRIDEAGEIIMTIVYTNWDDSKKYRELPLAEYLAQRAAETAAKA